MTALILVANASEANVFTCENLRTQSLIPTKELLHPESRQKGADLVTDRPGHYQAGAVARSSYEKAKPKEVEADRFMGELANMLHAAENTSKYDKLIVVMPAHSYGQFGKHYHGDAKQLVHIGKDYTKCKQDELLEHIRQHIFI